MTSEQKVAELGPEVERELVKSLREGRRAARETHEFRRRENVYSVAYWLIMITAACFLLAIVVRKWQNLPYLPVTDDKD